METQTPSVGNPTSSFEAGTTVVYGLHGKCTVIAIEKRQISGQEVAFYKLEIIRSTLSRSSRLEPAIWVPVSAANDKGLRSPITQAEMEEIQKIFATREYYFRLDESWSAVLPKLEAIIRKEGALGLAKAYSYLFTLKKRQVVSTPEVTRFCEAVTRSLFREMSDFAQEPARALEEKAIRAMRYKLLPDS